MKTLFVDLVGWGILIGIALTLVTLGGASAAGGPVNVKAIAASPYPYLVLVAGYLALKNYRAGWRRLVQCYERNH